MVPAKPTLDLLRALTDEHVLRALVETPRLTRAELAARTGISKPTVGESVRRLAEAGVLRDTGERTTGRGRVGSYYALADDLGVALVVAIAPDGLVAETVDVHGRVVTRAVEPVDRPARPDRVAALLREVVQRVASGGGPVRLGVVSAADPVDRATGRLRHLPDAPFLVGELSPVDVLAPVVAGPVVVDNDVNWAARAERAPADPGGPARPDVPGGAAEPDSPAGPHDAPGGSADRADAPGTPDGPGRAYRSDALDDMAYLHLGEGLGCAVVADGEVRRGSGGLAGEIAHVVTRGPGDRAVAFTEVFAELGLRRPGSTAVDVERLLDAVRADWPAADGVLAALAEAVCGVVAAVVALADPQVVVLGGAWGADPAVLRAVTASLAHRPRVVPVRAARVTAEPALTGARQRGLDDLRTLLLTRRRA